MKARTTEEAASAELLFLCHRIPYPPNKGDKIRSYNMLRHLASRYAVHLGAFVDDPDDWQHVPALRELCASVELVPLAPKRALLRSATGLLTGEPLGLPYYRDARLQRWCDARVRSTQLAGVFVFSSTMAQYALPCQQVPRVLDLCDVDSDKWRQYAQRRRWPMSWVYRREGTLLEACERDYARQFDAVLLVSEAEAALFRKLAPESADRVLALRNGVDTVFFDPALPQPTPFPAEQRALVFTGAMDYWANADAVDWFAREVLPEIRQLCPQAHFWIVGSRPTEAVQRLDRLPGVSVTGSVPDVRPYLAHAHVVVAPLRVARGIQNKVLEALSMARPVVASSAALDGLEGFDVAGGSHVPGTRRADRPSEYAIAVAQLLLGTVQIDGTEGRRYVCERYGWQASLAAFDRLFAARPQVVPTAALPAAEVGS